MYVIVCIASILDYSLDLSISGVQHLKSILLESIEGASYSAHLALSVGFLVVLATFAATWTRFVDPFAVGSGIPEMKTIISGDLRREPERYLRAKTLLAKSVGLVCSIGTYY